MLSPTPVHKKSTSEVPLWEFQPSASGEEEVAVVEHSRRPVSPDPRKRSGAATATATAARIHPPPECARGCCAEPAFAE